MAHLVTLLIRRAKRKFIRNPMPYVLPAAFRTSEKFALVLAFGRLSVLEVCSMISGLRSVELPCERVGVIEIERSSSSHLPRLAGIHKFAQLSPHFQGDQEGITAMAKSFAEQLDKVQRVALSGYDTPEDDYEELVRAVLDAMRDAGFRKVRLLRPKGNELVAEEVEARDALDVIAFPYGEGYGLGPTAWVADVASIRQRALAKPAPRSEISLSPRLARTLVNLAGLSPGQLLLDPFCGSGTILGEGLSRSLFCVGVDSSQGRLRDARKNLDWARRRGAKGRFRLELGDARDLGGMLHGSRVDGVVTEPLLLPRLDYKPSTSVAGEMVEAAGETYAAALSSIASVLKAGSRAVIVVPVIHTSQGDEVSITLDGGPLGLKPYQPGPTRFQYPVPLSFESTRWIRRAVYVFEARA